MEKVVLVTGGSRGIGAAVARLAARDGYAVGVNYNRNADAAARVVGDVERVGRRAVAVQATVSDEAQVAELFAEVTEALGPITALVNNAGITGGKAEVGSLDSATLHRVFETNVFGAFYCAREAIKRMSLSAGGHGGSIVNISSVAAVLGAGGERVHYAASKGAIDAFTLGLGRELGTDGIRVNAVRPGLIDTDMNRSAEDPDRLARLGPSVPMGRTGTAEEIAEAVVWLMSDAARYVTGHVLTVSGGR